MGPLVPRQSARGLGRSPGCEEGPLAGGSRAGHVRLRPQHLAHVWLTSVVVKWVNFGNDLHCNRQAHRQTEPSSAWGAQRPDALRGTEVLL